MPTPSAPHSPCIDAETLAAWSEGSLSAVDAAEVELHLSDCVRCQSVLAAFARTMEAHQDGHREGRRLNSLWLVPLAAAAAILIWIAIPKREPAQAPASVVARNEAPAVLQETRIGPPVPATAAPEEKRASGQLAQAATPADKANAEENAKAEGATKADSRERQTAGRATASTPLARNLPPSGSGRSGAPGGQAGRSADAAPASPTRGAVLMDGISPLPASPPPSSAPTAPQAQPAPSRLPQPSPPPPPPVTRSAGNVATDAAKAMPESVAVQSGAAAAPRSANEPVFSTLTSSLAKQVALEIVSADPGAVTGPPAQGTAVGGVAGGAGGRGGGGGGGRGGAGVAAGRGGPVGFAPTPTRWRILGPGTAERSTDGGRAWDPITINPPVTITSGSSPSPAVCWLIGPRGVVLLSVDGLRFDRRPFPETTDLSSIRATDAAHASITTSAGRVFETSDGGRSWQARD